MQAAAPSPASRASDVLAFWREAGPARWFRKDDAFDADFRQGFLPLHEAAASGRLGPWSGHAEGALALVILLDQFPRNAFRRTARMYATDAMARRVAHPAIDAGFDRQVDAPLRQFFYLPLMHSEQLADHDRCVRLSRVLGGESERYALHHREIIERFGRFPHRNAVLGRTSTAAEEAFLAEGGFAG
jgi:uncharacterized protein (DUF924 family)